MQRSSVIISKNTYTNRNRNLETLIVEEQELPTYDPMSHVAKKEKSRVRFAEKATHAIPILILLCVTILCFFSSNPGLL